MSLTHTCLVSCHPLSQNDRFPLGLLLQQTAETVVLILARVRTVYLVQIVFIFVICNHPVTSKHFLARLSFILRIAGPVGGVTFLLLLHTLYSVGDKKKDK